MPKLNALGLVGLAAALAAAGAAPCGCAKPQRPVKLGVAVPISGDLATAGRGIERAVRLAVEEAAASGGLAGPVELRVEDDGGEAAKAVEAAERLAADPEVFAVVGHLTSGCSLAAARVYSGAGLAMVTPSATAPEVTAQQLDESWTGPRVVFRLPPSDSIQGSFSADFALARFGFKSAFVVRDGTPYGDGLAREFSRRFSARGGRVAGETAVARGQKDFSDVAGQAAASGAQVLFFGGVFTETAPLLRQLRAAGLKTAFLSGDGSKNEDLFKLAGAAVDGAYFTVGGVPVENLPSAADFVERYKARYGGAFPRTFDHYAYVAAGLALSALRKSGPERSKIVEALRRSETDTMVGLLAFDGKGDTQKSVITMTKAVFQEKRFEPVY